MLSNKDIALAFQRLIISGNIREAYDAYVSPDFRHHNPYFKGDRESLLRGMEENAKQFPNKIVEAKQVLEDGELVAIHSRLKLSPDMPDIIVVHIFRFENNKIVELWDVSQQVPAESLNENGMV